ncbi:glycosyltransferase family 2 protein [Betaproteobacteria bacterium SCN2]|jgi:glycosyltransferase involved in cell wall biosynthesis|nr:glycosyltransferase family 2 protein [Betaproteobacteria bacterium SCN2]
MDKRYSVVIPAYNAADTLEDALRSILEQDIPPIEIIVVDDGSTDDTAAIVGAFGAPVTLLQQPNRGCGAATNAGMARVSSPLMAFLDADDAWLPGKAALQLERLAAEPGIAGLFGHGQNFKGSLAAPERGAIYGIWGRTTMMMRTEAARRIGDVIDPVGGRGELVDWIARGRELGLRFEMLPELLAMRRIRPGSLSYGPDREKDLGYLEVVKRALDRKRGKTG